MKTTQSILLVPPADPQILLDKSVELLELSCGAATALMNRNLVYLRQLCELTPDQLRGMRWVGAKAVWEIQAELAKWGLHLKDAKIPQPFELQEFLTLQRDLKQAQKRMRVLREKTTRQLQSLRAQIRLMEEALSSRPHPKNFRPEVRASVCQRARASLPIHLDRLSVAKNLRQFFCLSTLMTDDQILEILDSLPEHLRFAAEVRAGLYGPCGSRKNGLTIAKAAGLMGVRPQRLGDDWTYKARCVFKRVECRQTLLAVP